MAYVDPHCRAIAAKAAKGALTEQEILDAFDRIESRRRSLEAAGMATGKAERLRKWAAQEGERAKIAAAMRRRHAGLNAIVRDRVDRQIKGMIAGGVTQIVIQQQSIMGPRPVGTVIVNGQGPLSNGSYAYASRDLVLTVDMTTIGSVNTYSARIVGSIGQTTLGYDLVCRSAQQLQQSRK